MMQGGWQHGMEDDVVRSVAWQGETDSGLRVREREREKCVEERENLNKIMVNIFCSSIYTMPIIEHYCYTMLYIYIYIFSIGHIS